MTSASWWNEKLNYNRWLGAEFNTFKCFDDFKRAVDYSDDNLGEKEIKALLKQVLKRDDKILVDRVINYIAENTPIGKRTLRQIIKELKIEALNKNSRKQNQETNQKSLFSGETLIPEKYKKNIDLFLKSEKKFKYIEEILDYNIVGEKNNKVLLFILSSGSFFKIYQIIVIIGESSGGKSFIATEVLSLFPKKYFFNITSASEKAIHYREWNELVFYISEIQRNEQFLETLKDFGDDGIKYIVVLKDEKGNPKTVEINIGLMSIIASTTKENLNYEFMNRA